MITYKTWLIPMLKLPQHEEERMLVASLRELLHEFVLKLRSLKGPSSSFLFQAIKAIIQSNRIITCKVYHKPQVIATT